MHSATPAPPQYTRHSDVLKLLLKRCGQRIEKIRLIALQKCIQVITKQQQSVVLHMQVPGAALRNFMYPYTTKSSFRKNTHQDEFSAPSLIVGSQWVGSHTRAAFV